MNVLFLVMAVVVNEVCLRENVGHCMIRIQPLTWILLIKWDDPYILYGIYLKVYIITAQKVK